MIDENESETGGDYILPPPRQAGDRVGPADDPDRYELVGAGITGGEGTTWRARYHGRLQAPLPLAVKQLRPPSGAAPGWPSDDDRRRWQDQTALLRHVRSGHVVAPYEVFPGPPPHPAGEGAMDALESAYLVMEWVEGPTLSELCRGRPATRETIAARLGYVAQAADALGDLSSATRSAGNPSLHRDLKPSNCIVNRERGLVLIDISTLRLVADGFDPSGLHTPAYTAPEALSAPHLSRTAATEAYSLGALAAFCLTGRDPAAGDDLRAELAAVTRRAGVRDPEALATQVMAALDPDPGRRPTDLAGWSRRLGERGRSRRRWPPYAETAVLLALLATGSSWTSGSGPAESPVVIARGTITAPTADAEVKQCSHFSGTATVPPGTTLVLAMRNLVNGDPIRYAQVVFGWDDPARLTRWRGAQFFGSANGTVGQRYRVELVAVRVDAARAWTGMKDTGNRLIASGTVLDHVDLRRVRQSAPPLCNGP